MRRKRAAKRALGPPPTRREPVEEVVGVAIEFVLNGGVRAVRTVVSVILN